MKSGDNTTRYGLKIPGPEEPSCVVLWGCQRDGCNGVEVFGEEKSVYVPIGKEKWAELGEATRVLLDPECTLEILVIDDPNADGEVYLRKHKTRSIEVMARALGEIASARVDPEQLLGVFEVSVMLDSCVVTA